MAEQRTRDDGAVVVGALVGVVSANDELIDVVDRSLLLFLRRNVVARSVVAKLIEIDDDVAFRIILSGCERRLIQFMVRKPLNVRGIWLLQLLCTERLTAAVDCSSILVREVTATLCVEEALLAFAAAAAELIC